MPIQNIFLDKELQGHRSAIYALTPSFEPGKILSAGSEGWIVEWDPACSEIGVKIADCEDRIFSLLVWPESDLIIAGGMSGDLYFMSRTDSTKPRRIRLHKGPVYRLLKIGDMLVAAGGEGMLSVWDPSKIECVGNLLLNNLRWRSACYDAERQQLLLGDNMGQLHRLLVPDLQPCGLPQKRHGRTLFSMLLLPQENKLITGGLDAVLCVSDRNGDTSVKLNAHWYCINDLVWMQGFPFIASASRDKSIRIWDVHSFDLVKELSKPKFAGHHHSVNSLVWLPNERLLCSAGEDARILTWKLE